MQKDALEIIMNDLARMVLPALIDILQDINNGEKNMPGRNGQEA